MNSNDDIYNINILFSDSINNYFNIKSVLKEHEIKNINNFYKKPQQEIFTVRRNTILDRGISYMVDVISNIMINNIVGKGAKHIKSTHIVCDKIMDTIAFHINYETLQDKISEGGIFLNKRR